jgi:hypothetical protein
MHDIHNVINLPEGLAIFQKVIGEFSIIVIIYNKMQIFFVAS